MTAQFIKTPSGDELVVLPRDEYEQLIRAAEEAFEDAADVAAYDAAISDPAGMDTLPAELSRLILSSGGLLRGLRLWRGLAPDELAQRVGLPVSAVIDIEDRRTSRSDELSRSLAKVLDVPERWLIG